MRRVAFSGPSNSGKTTLIIKVAKILQEQGFKVGIIKHDPKDKASFDTPGKDSHRFSMLGAEVVVVSPTRTTYFSKEEKSIDEISDMLYECDILIVEGLKHLDLPRISLFRGAIDESYLEFSKAIATNGLKCSVNIPNFDINDASVVAKWVLDNAEVYIKKGAE
ncbi:MAG: molybdopterin-guanine dinucleotide biosynthesis protein B [Campylobacter sp.]|nr:molybdopterin-guanine dinucleotide biosynthesis protein B [Campylobacter sp.]